MTDTLKDEIIALTVEAVEKAYKMGLIAGARTEREACAMLCEGYTDTSDADHESHGYACAAAIRARTKGEINT